MRIDNRLHWVLDVALIYQDCQLLNPGLLDYLIPTIEDLPTDLWSILVENADGVGPYGSKGIGESGLMPTAPAIARAIGVRLTALPLAPERVWQAMRAAPAHQTSSAKESLPPP